MSQARYPKAFGSFFIGISLVLVGFFAMSPIASSVSFWANSVSGQEIAEQPSDSLEVPVTIAPLDETTLPTPEIILASDNSSLVALSGPEGTLADIEDTNDEGTIDEQTLYTIRSGDTLATVAKLFELKSETVRLANNLAKGASLKPGSTLKIPATDGVPYKVLKGDTVASIAKKFKVDADEVIAFNLMEGPDEIRSGQTIFIPGGKELIVPAATIKKASGKGVGRASGSVKSIAFNGTYAKPAAGPLTSGYGMRWGKMHTGIDIGAPTGTPIYAAASGTVRQAKRGNGYGNMVVISHGNGTETLYAHMSRIATSAGSYVNQGELIGYVGSTGRSTGPHLHFEIRKGGTPVNPASYLN